MKKTYKESYKMNDVLNILNNKSVYDFSNYVYLNNYTENEILSKNIMRYLRHKYARDSYDFLPKNLYTDIIFSLLNSGFIVSEESEFKLLPIDSTGVIKKMLNYEEVICETPFGNYELYVNDKSFYYYDDNSTKVDISFTDICNYNLFSYQLV